MHALSLSLLGPYVASLGNERLLHFRTRSGQALLALLVMGAETGAPLRRDELAELLWPGMPPGSGRKNLRQTLYELRQLIPEAASRHGNGAVPFILADRDVIEVNADADYFLDVSEFNRLLAKAKPASLAAAVDLYRGDFLSDFYLPESEPFEAWAGRRRAQLQRETLRALETLSEHYLQEAEYGEAERYARRQLEIDDLQETAVRQLMAALAGRGERPAALAAYEAHRGRLQEALEIAPAAETTALYESIREGARTVPHQKTGAEIPLVADRASHNLPAQATAFIGRERELETIERRLLHDPSCRLLTLLGPGGSGKTRLAIEAGERLAANGGATFADGVWFVPLAPLSEHESIIPAIAGATGLCFYAESEPRQQILDYLREKEMLLILDNFEHLLREESAAFLASLLTEARRVKLMVTSRERLNVRGEHVFPVEGLETPQNGEGDGAVDLEIVAYSGVNLFLQSARRVRPDFKVTEENAPAVARICRLVEGMPLGLELAASWVELLEPAAIADEVAHTLDFLEGDWVGVPERQRSLRAVFEASWKLLPADERRILQSLSAFHGGFDREAAEAVAGAFLKDLRALVGKSWLVRDADERYAIHPLLCQYAAEKLWADPDTGQRVREAHTEYYASLLPKLAEAMKGPQQNETFDLMAVEFENARAAWDYLIETGRLERIVKQMLPCLLHFCGARGRGRDLLSLVLAARQAAEAEQFSARERAILTVAESAFQPGEYVVRFFVDLLAFDLPVAGLERAQRTLDAKGMEEVSALWKILVAALYGWRTGEKEVIGRLRDLAGECRHRGDRWSQAFALQCLGSMLSMLWPLTVDPDEEEWEQAEAMNEMRKEEIWQSLTEAAAIFQELGDQLERAHTLRQLGLFLLTKQPAEAAGYLQEAHAPLLAIGNEMAAAHVFGSLGKAQIYQGNFEEGFSLIHRMRALYQRLGLRKFISYAFSVESLEALRYGELEQARWARQQALAIGRETNDLLDGVAWSLWELGEIERVAGNLDLGRHYFDEALQIFERRKGFLGIDLGFAFYYRGLGDIAQRKGDYVTAQRQFQKYLKISQEMGHDWSVVYAFCGLGRAAVGASEHEAARSHFLNALKKANLAGYPDMQLVAVAGLASLALATGDAEEAIVLAILVREHVASWRETKGRAAAVVEAARSALPAAAVDAATERGRRLELKSVLDAFVSGQTAGGGRVDRASHID